MAHQDELDAILRPDSLGALLDQKTARIAELETALRPFGDAFRFVDQMGSMRREFIASMTCAVFTEDDLRRAAELTANS